MEACLARKYSPASQRASLNLQSCLTLVTNFAHKFSVLFLGFAISAVPAWACPVERYHNKICAVVRFHNQDALYVSTRTSIDAAGICD